MHDSEDDSACECGLTRFEFTWAKKVLTAAGVAYIANNKYDREMAINAIESEAADAVAFGVPFISNPDLPERLRANAALTPANPKTFYSPGPEGYTDYATMA